jgi:signal transduction histidine kinase
MNSDVNRVADACADALRRYMSNPDEGALRDAYEIGRTALATGVGVLDMAHVCSHALTEVSAVPTDERWAGAAERFFTEALSPFEMAHRGFKDANAVLRRVNQLLEEQTRRIASLLHDEAGQLLTPLHLKLSDLARRVPSDAAEEIEAIRTLLRVLEERLRTISHELRPPILDHVGLAPALELLGESVSRRWGIGIQVRSALERPLPPSVETTVYRAVHEALMNVTRHAQATRVDVSLERDAHGIECTVADDGVGYDWSGSRPSVDGLGLAGIRERAVAFGGGLHVGPTLAGRGTVLTLRIPLEG